MTAALEWFRSRALDQQALVLVSLVSAALTTLTVLLAVTAVLLRWRNTVTARRWARVEGTWEDLVLEVLEGTRPPDGVRGSVPPGDAPLFVEYLSRFSRRLRGPEADRIRQLADPFLPAVARRLRHRDPGIRARALQVLGLLGLPRYGDRLIVPLRDPDPLVAMVAARALARREHPEYAPHILAHLDRFRNWDPRFMATMLADIGPAVAPELLAALADPDRPARVRTVAADALARLNYLPAGDAAAEAVSTSEDRELVAAALRLLRQVGRLEHLPVVRSRVGAEDDVIREHAVTALAALAHPEELATVVRYLDDPSPWVRLATARALRRVADGRLLHEAAAGSGPSSLIARAALAESPA